MNKKILFLDDVRTPLDCVKYMRGENYKFYNSEEDWNIVRTFHDFVEYITLNGVPDFISFDHDLADEHYSSEIFNYNEDYMSTTKKFVEKTGYDCAKWLITYCNENGIPLPDYEIHSMNPVGRDNIRLILEKYKKLEEKQN